jgi:iron(III) transport system ATP-binding protein
MLETVGLAHAAARYPHELSGGQQQRVALARALAPEPRLLLLDEPFANLDVDLRERLGLELRQLLKAAGITALMVTHDQHEAFAIADDIGVMSDGRIQQWDSAYNLYHRPANRFVADFVGQGVFLPGVVAEDNHVLMELGRIHSPQPVRCTEHGDLCPDGCRVDVLLRPDDVVHDDASPVTAEVLGKAFRGAEFLYTLRLGSGATVLSLVPSHHNHAIGERIGIRLELDHVVAFKREGTATATVPALDCAV